MSGIIWLDSYTNHRKPGRGGVWGDRHFDWALGRRLWDQGVTRSEIAGALGCTVSAVDKRRGDDHWPRRQGDRARTGGEPQPTERRCESCGQRTPAAPMCAHCGAAA